MAILTEEQGMLRDMARDWAANKAPVSALRALRDKGERAGFDPAMYRDMADMGWAGIVVPESYGGSEFGFLGLGLVIEETGRTLTASPLLSTGLVASSAILLAGSDAQKEEWLPKLAGGETVASFAIDEGPRHDPDAVEMTAEKSGDGWVLSGTKAFVPEGDSADLFIVVAKTGTGRAMFLVPGDARGLTRSIRRVIDSRSHAEITLQKVELPSNALLGEEAGDAVVNKVLDRARIGTAAEMLGLCVQAFDTTLDYLKTRE